jgi:multiple sugar transport system permease protein
VLILAMMMPRQVIMVPLFIMMVKLGWLNTYQGLILPLVALPYTVFLFRQFIRTLPAEIFDAARIDGASELEIYWRIVLPLAKPALAVVAIFAFIFTWNDYMWQLIMVTQRDMATLPVAISTVITARTTIDYGLGMAAATFAAIPMMLIFVLFQSYFIKGITMGSVK